MCPSMHHGELSSFFSVISPSQPYGDFMFHNAMCLQPANFSVTRVMTVNKALTETSLTLIV